ncbi:5f4c22bb-8faf-4aa9-9fe1-4552ace7a774 [Thermothielavioides terrestris]|uniref:5f4c22bb-8faf-4aa9-9fe1-4552ace7a774 n=1 Tax=Thermothielavioides terrestris TaxID=2587410 RepID=A0A3S4AMN4_9PEZI|nr:5f4c22bb-8faf-4aa9-9fe1-4552ace7a774 [Thermothielavioides terrestris]
MASLNQCLASLARLSLAAPARPTVSSTIPRFLLPSATAPLVRHASGGGGMRKRPVKKKRTYKTYRCYDLSAAQQYLRAFEVGRPPNVVKYELAVKLKAHKGGPVIRNRVRLPFATKQDTRIGVICPEDSPLAAEAKELGAVAVGEESLFESIRQGNIPFNKLICHVDSVDALKKANLGRILGPKGLMPNPKTRTITRDLKTTMNELIGAEEYKERDGVVRIAIGQLGFTPQMLSANVKTFMSLLKEDINNSDENHPKALDEVVLSSTNGPGFSLNGEFLPTDAAIKPEDLQSVM